jgi:ChrR Cupin-like domain
VPDPAHIEEIQAQAALYVLGALPPEEAARFEQRLRSGCPLCHAEFDACEVVAEVLPLAAPEAVPPPHLRARILAAIGGPEEPGLGEGVIIRAGENGWRPSPVPGVELRRLHGGSTMLVRMAPKTHYPPHHHDLTEQCLMLEGSLTTNGVTARAGDFVYYPAGSDHGSLYTEDGCLFLVAYT